MIIGVSEEWGLESHLFGWRPERIARDCPCSLLIVRRFQPTPDAKASLAVAAGSPPGPKDTQARPFIARGLGGDP